MFSDEEVEAAVRRYLSTDVATVRMKSGSRDVLSAKEQIYDLVATALLLEPANYYYVVWLARSKLVQLISDQQADMVLIVNAAAGSSRTSKLLGPTTELSNAEAAIADLNTAFGSRAGGVSGSLGPGVERFRTAVERYIKAELVKNVVVNGNVTPTGEELRDTIRTTWLRASVRQEQIYDLTSAIAGALQEYRKAKLPDTAVQKIVGRIEARIQELQEILSSPTATRDSRAALLDLLAMRTLLARCSAFRAPQTLLAPLGADPTVGVLGGTVGASYSALGSVASPFNYAAGSTLSLTVDGSSVNVALPGASNATVATTVTLVFPVPASMEVTIQVDGAAQVTLTTAAWADGPTAATALSALAGVTVTWTGTALVFQSDSVGDASALQFIDGTPARVSFLAWAFGGSVQSATAKQVEIDTLLPLFPAEVAASIDEGVTFSFTGAREATVGQENYLWNKKAQGTGLYSDGTVQLFASVDLEALGVVPGDVVVLTAPSALTRTIRTVEGPRLVVNANVPAANNAYYVGPDYSGVEAGTRVHVFGATNTGYYRVLSGGSARLLLDRVMPTAASGLRATVTSRRLRVAARYITTLSSLGVLASTGASALGLTPVSAQPAALGQLQVSGADFISRSVLVGDRLELTGPGGTSYTATITAVGSDYLMLDPPVSYQVGYWRYAVYSAQGTAFEALAGAGAAFTSSVGDLVHNVEAAVSRLWRGSRYSSDLQAVLASYQSSLTALLSAATVYSVPRAPVVDQVVRTFIEEGFDRALDLFLGLQLSLLFSMPDDGVSYSSWLVRQSATVAREVVPVTKDPRDPMSQWRTLSTQSTSFDPRAEPEQ